MTRSVSLSLSNSFLILSLSSRYPHVFQLFSLLSLIPRSSPLIFDLSIPLSHPRTLLSFVLSSPMASRHVFWSPLRVLLPSTNNTLPGLFSTTPEKATIDGETTHLSPRDTSYVRLLRYPTRLMTVKVYNKYQKHSLVHQSIVTSGEVSPNHYYHRL